MSPFHDDVRERPPVLMTFKDDINNDIDFFLNNEEFAVDVLYNSVTIQGIFDDAFVSGAEDGVGVITTDPQILMKTSDLSSIAQGDIMNVNSVDYKVAEWHPDGTGMTLVLLSRD